MSLIIFGFFSNYIQGGKEVSDSLDQESLNFEISLPYLMGTSVTGSLPPLSYFFKLGFSAHSFTNYAALNMRQLTTETYYLKFIVEFYIESISIMIFENSLNGRRSTLPHLRRNLILDGHCPKVSRKGF